jgi:hypothetical protein
MTDTLSETALAMSSPPGRFFSDLLGFILITHAELDLPQAMEPAASGTDHDLTFGRSLIFSCVPGRSD